ncbi:hypothetical protein [Natronorubrum tibetense]|uniref:hypothetical protein n=1 Tax=Natronorubrum tibetense TaxID=63128 RepID=UPI00037982DA|nr:hypothetical protein [Natronorubrum tibetense]
MFDDINRVQGVLLAVAGFRSNGHLPYTTLVSFADGQLQLATVTQLSLVGADLFQLALTAVIVAARIALLPSATLLCATG